MDTAPCANASWESLVAGFRRKTFFCERLVLVQSGPRQIALRGSYLRRSARVAFYFGLAALFTLVFLLPPPPVGMGFQHRIVKTVGPFASLALLGSAVYASLRRDRILFDCGRHTVEFRWGIAPWARRVEVSLDELRAVLYVRLRDEAGSTALGVSLEEGGEHIHLATAKWRSELLPVFVQLKEVLRQRAVDLTRAPLSSANGGVCRTPIRTRVSRGRSHRLVVSGDEAVIQAPVTDSVVLVILGLVMIIFGVFLDRLMEVVPVWAYATVGAFVLLVWVIAFVIRPRRIVIRKDSWLKVPGRAYEGDLPDELNGSDIAAVQLCAVRGEGEHVPIPLVPGAMIPMPSYTVYQVNLVIQRPDGCRVNLFSDTDRFYAHDDAATLADFLRVPLLDHR